VKFVFLTIKDGKAESKNQWPPLNDAAGSDDDRPAAIQVTLQLDDWGEIERIVELAQ